MCRENTQETVISQQKLVSHKSVSNSNRPVMGGLMPLRLTEARPDRASVRRSGSDSGDCRDFSGNPA